MGKVILCTGKRADMPYLVRGAGIKVATIEELCYVLKHNIDMLDDSSIDRDMTLFMREELGIVEGAQEVEQLILSGASLCEKIIAILHCCDYYDEDEIAKIREEIEEIAGMSPAERRKRRADRYMLEGNLMDAFNEYRSILNSDEGTLSEVSKGDIKHNLAVVEINRGEMDEAIRLFNDAYVANQRVQSLKSYLMALKLSKNVARYRSEVQRLVTNVQIFNEVENAVNGAEEDFEQSNKFTEISRLKVLWQQGRHSEAKRLSDEMIMGMKQMYRHGAKGTE